MTSFEIAVERKQWQTVAYRLLLAVSEAAQKLPPESIDELIELLMPDAEKREGGRGD